MSDNMINYSEKLAHDDLEFKKNLNRQLRRWITTHSESPLRDEWESLRDDLEPLIRAAEYVLSY